MLRFEAINWAQSSIATQKPKQTTFARMDVDKQLLPPPQCCLKEAEKVCLQPFPSRIYPCNPCCDECIYVLRVSSGNSREANSPTHSSSCPHFKTSRRPSSTDPDLNPALLSGILRRAGLFITQHALGVDEGETATQGYTREECKEWERVQGWDPGLFTADSVFLWGSQPSFAA